MGGVRGDGNRGGRGDGNRVGGVRGDGDRGEEVMVTEWVG